MASSASTAGAEGADRDPRRARGGARSGQRQAGGDDLRPAVRHPSRRRLGARRLRPLEPHPPGATSTPPRFSRGGAIAVRVQLNDIAHSFKPGHRIRVALSTSYWPISFPMPEPVLMTVFTGAPPWSCRCARRAEGCRAQRLPAAAGATPLAQTVLRKGDAAAGRAHPRHRRERLHPSRGHRHLSDRCDRPDDRSDQDRHLRIKTDDPLSADITIKWTQKLARGDWRVRTETRRASARPETSSSSTPRSTPSRATSAYTPSSGTADQADLV